MSQDPQPSTNTVEPSSFKIVIVWLLVGLAVYLAIEWYLNRQTAARVTNITTVSGQALQIERARDGHYHLVAQLNGKPVKFMLDTGATTTAIPARVAKVIGIEPQGSTEVSTANGSTTAALARANFAIPGLVQIENLRITVLEDMGRDGLLGMDVLGKLRLVQEADRLTLELRR
jgi:aspartyl protease family protein